MIVCMSGETFVWRATMLLYKFMRFDNNSEFYDLVYPTGSVFLKVLDKYWKYTM